MALLSTQLLWPELGDHSAPSLGPHIQPTSKSCSLESDRANGLSHLEKSESEQVNEPLRASVFSSMKRGPLSFPARKVLMTSSHM